MKIYKKLLMGILLVLFTLIGIELLSGTTITIKSKGRGTTIMKDDGSYTFQCDNQSDNDCTLTVNYPTP